MGEEWKTVLRTAEEAQEHYEEGLDHIKKARAIFDNIVAEPLRQWETYNELGSLYLDWAYLSRYEVGSEYAIGQYQEAIKYLEQSVEIARKYELTHQMVDSYDDLSQAYADIGVIDKHNDYTQKREYYVHKVKDSVPPAYKLTKKGFTELQHPIAEWWLQLGKLHLGKAVREINQVVDTKAESSQQSAPDDTVLAKAAEDYAYAVAYFQRYSPYSAHLGRTLRSIQGRIKRLPAERIVYMYKLINKFSKDHNIDLNRLLHLLENTLGIEQSEPV
jgi:tetratricopeptide (TPR) repeat protein